MFFDTHAHLNDKKFADDIAEVIKRAWDAKVSKILVASYDEASSSSAVSIANNWENIYCSVGIHPHDAKEYSEASGEILTKLALNNKKVVAIGEIGLDYHYENSDREIQKEVFYKQIEIASKLKLPFIVHNRDAHGDTVEILQRAFSEGLLLDSPGVLHCYSGSLETAKILIDLGFYISFAGPVTFKNATKLVEVMREIPIERLFIETDCPYLSPEPFRGKRNEPAYVRFIAKKIAELKNIPIEEVAKITTDNACKLFGIK